MEPRVCVCTSMWVRDHINIVRESPRVTAIHTDSYILWWAQSTMFRCKWQRDICKHKGEQKRTSTKLQAIIQFKILPNENVIDSYARQFLVKSTFRTRKIPRNGTRIGNGRKDISLLWWHNLFAFWNSLKITP